VLGTISAHHKNKQTSAGSQLGINRPSSAKLKRRQIMRFRDRAEAGQLLADNLTAYTNRPDVLVLALPRGGVPVGYEVARALNAPLDVFIVRKLGVPGQEELA